MKISYKAIYLSIGILFFAAVQSLAQYQGYQPHINSNDSNNWALLEVRNTNASRGRLRDLPFPLVKANIAASVYIDTADAEVVSIAGHCFAGDIQKVTGILPIVNAMAAPKEKYMVIAGTIGHSVLIDKLIQNHSININPIKGQWETFGISVVNSPFPGVSQALVIVGSDRRGTAYGFFELSRMMGVSPYTWWADIVPRHQNELYVSAGANVIGPPSVKFRGIFLNDEDWGLQPWAAKKMDPDIKDIGPNTYAHLFELLLRLKANYIWPAMHPCTKAFWYYKENPKVADKYAIVLGASHCEPMLRDNVFEWADNYQNEFGQKPGEWRYDVNKQQIYPFWEARVHESKNIDAVYTVGMRGIHDGSMPGPPSKTEKVKLLENVIADQREMLSHDIAKPAYQIPQIFCPYKEVLDLYQAGMKLPDDVTICWADDNHGYIRQVSNPAEQKRSGGSGVYYHLSYWGVPRDYLWLSSVSPSLISYEMTKAYQFGADKVWILNVGDIKPAEMETQFYLDLAWNVKGWTPEKASDYVKAWATETFGPQYANAIAEIKSEYYKLAASAKPEHTNAVNFTEMEVTQRLAHYQKIDAQAEGLGMVIPASLKDAYFELVAYPVKAARLMNEKIYFARKSLLLAHPPTKSESLAFAQKAIGAYNQIKVITQKYNEQIAGGKWNGMMSDHPRDQTVFAMPDVTTPLMFDSTHVKAQAVQTWKTQPRAIIAADQYTSKKECADTHFEVIDGLGITGKGLTLSPIIPKSEIGNLKDAPYVEYTAYVTEGSNTIRVKCLPTFHLYDGLGLRYAISVNGDEPQVVNIDAPAESKVWSVNVLQGYSEGKTMHQTAKAGQATIRVYLPDPGVVLCRIEVE